MKHCPYCQTDYDSQKEKCPSCQATDAKIKCDNCGTVHDAAHCPNCGFGANEVLSQCPKCGKKTKERFCPGCGHDFSGRIDAEGQNKTTTVVHVSQRDEDAKAAATAKAAKTKKIWVIVLLILFAPVGIPLMWLWMKDWNKILKIVLSAVCGVFFLVAIFSPSSDKEAGDSTQAAVVTDAEGQIVTTEKTTRVTTTKNPNMIDGKFELVGGMDAITFDGDSFAVYIGGTLKNTTSKTYSYAQVVFTLYDADGNQVGTAMDNINNWEAGGTWKFKAMALSDFDTCKLSEVTAF